MSNVRLYMNKVNGWDKIDTAMTANDLEVGHLAFKLPNLRVNSQRMRNLYAQHAGLAGSVRRRGQGQCADDRWL